MVLHGIWHILTFQFRGKDGPLVTKLSVTGFVFPTPASMYTEITEQLHIKGKVVPVLSSLSSVP
jgi:hypothetical protein